MAIIAELAGIGLSSASGGILGILGSSVGRVANFFENRQAFKQKQATWVYEERRDDNNRAHEITLHGLNQAQRAQETEQELEIIAQAGSYRGLENVIKHERDISNTGSPRVASILRLVRPFLTVLLMAMLAWALNKTTNETVHANILEDLVFITSTAVLFWFGDRYQKGKRHV